MVTGVDVAPPNATRSLTQRALLNRERESFTESRGQGPVDASAVAAARELSRLEKSSQVVARTAENDKRRELSLSAWCVNRFASGNSAN